MGASNIVYTPCHAEHILQVEPYAQAEADKRLALNEWYWAAIDVGVGMSAFYGGKCLGCAGFMRGEGGDVIVWSIISKYAGPFMTPLTRKARKVISCHQRILGRDIYAQARRDFPPAGAWLTMLGFEECRGAAVPEGIRNPDPALADYVRGYA